MLVFSFGQLQRKCPIKVSLENRIKNGEPLIADGSLITSLYEKGFYINRSFEELSVTDAATVKEVHEEFKASGANLLSTNTFNAIHTKLSEYGLQNSIKEIIEASIDITQSVLDDDTYCMGTMGPLGVMLEPLGRTSIEIAKTHFKQVFEIMEAKDVDAYQLLGFHDINELRAAIESIKEISSKPIFAHIAINERLSTTFGHSLNEFVQLTDELGVTVVGLSGEVGPSRMLTALTEIKKLTNKPISLKPNAGTPHYVNDQYIYLCNPDYLGKFAKRFSQAGAQIIGGHSGVYESHIKAIKNSLRMTKSLNTEVKISEDENLKPIHDKPKKEILNENKSLLGKKLAAGEKVISIEILPPKGIDADAFLGLCKRLDENKIDFVNIPDGARAVSRMSSLQLASFVKNNFNLEPIPHFTSRDRNLLGLQSDLLGCHINGIRNVLLVTGDPPKLGNCPGATAVYDVDAIGMTHIAKRMNKGLDIGGGSMGTPTEFLIGVALNPTAANLELEMKRFKYKIEAGADFAITQPIYSPDALKEFLDKMGDISIPIIMGVWPLVSLRNAEFLKHELPGVEVPDWVIEKMGQAKSKEEAIQFGIEIGRKTIEQTRDIVQGFQITAPFNKIEIAMELAREV